MMECDKTVLSCYNTFIRTSIMNKFLLLTLRHKQIILTIIGVTIGILSGTILKYYSLKSWSKRNIMYIKFPGDIFMRIVNCLILPFVISAIISASCNLNKSSPIGLMAVYYYLTTTTIGIALSVILVETIRPGELLRNKYINVPMPSKTVMTVDNILDLFRNLVPENIVEACIHQYHTVLRKPANISTVPINEWPITIEYVSETNLLGLIFHSLLLSLAIRSMGTNGKPLSDFFNSLSTVMMEIMKWVTLITPISVSFLITGRLLEINELDILNQLGFYILTVFVGLVLHGFIILPLLYWIITRKSPYKIIFKLSPAIATACGTSSSTATVPSTIKCLESLGIHSEITKFIVPIGAAINMDGIALYEAIGAMFIIQLRGLQFPLLKIIAISITCTISCIGASGLPSGGYMMLIMVLNSIEVPIEDVAFIIIVDWFIDRFRTTINIIGDAFCASIISHFYKNDLQEV